LEAWAKVIYVNRQNKTIKKNNIDGVVVCVSFGVNMARFGKINDDQFT